MGLNTPQRWLSANLSVRVGKDGGLKPTLRFKACAGRDVGWASAHRTMRSADSSVRVGKDGGLKPTLRCAACYVSLLERNAATSARTCAMSVRISPAAMSASAVAARLRERSAFLADA